MKEHKNQLVNEALALLITRTVSHKLAEKLSPEEIHRRTFERWQGEAEKLASDCRNSEELYSALLVRLVASIVGKSIELADGRHEAGGVAIPADFTREQTHAAFLSAPKSRKGKQTILSVMDREEIQGEISRVLSYREAWKRALTSEDWNLCFSRVQSSDCLNLNRRWKRLENREQEELTLEILAQPTCDIATDEKRESLLATYKEQATAWIHAAAKVNPSRKSASTVSKWISHLEKVCEGTEGNGMDKRERRRQRQEFREYLALGQKATNMHGTSAFQPLELALASLAIA